MLKTRIINKGLKLSIVYDDNLPSRLNGDPLRLGQVLLNILSNAVKFTEYGSINIKCEVDIIIQDTVILKISITDTGIGLTEDEKSKLFNSFSQADSSITRRYGGTGLGLSISKGLIELMDGTIEVKSEYRKGSTFSFTFACKVLKNIKSEKKESIVPSQLMFAQSLEQEKQRKVFSCCRRQTWIRKC